MRAQLGLAAAILITSLVAAACGREEPAGEEAEREGPARTQASAPQLPAIEGCELLTGQEIEAATGIPPGQPEDVSQLDGRLPMCQWPSADGSQIQLVHLLVTQTILESYDQFAEQARQQLGADFSEDDWQRIDGIGDFGVWLSEEYAGGILQVYEEGRMVQVTVETVEGRDELEASKDLVLAALDRLD